MAKLIDMPVNSEATSRYLVPIHASNDADLENIVMAGAENLSPALQRLLPMAMSRFEHAIHAAPGERLGTPSPDLFRALGIAESKLAVLESADQFVVVGWTYPTQWPPLFAWSARVAALLLAEELETMVIDAVVPGIWTVDEMQRGLRDAPGEVHLSDWTVVIQSPEPSGSWLTTKGLTRFGLPELSLRAVPSELDDPCGMALTAIAQALLARHLPSLQSAHIPASIAMDPIITVTTAHVAHAYPVLSADLADAAVAVRLEFEVALPDRPAPETLCAIRAPQGDDIPASTFVADLANALSRTTDGGNGPERTASIGE